LSRSVCRARVRQQRSELRAPQRPAVLAGDSGVRRRSRPEDFSAARFPAAASSDTKNDRADREASLSRGDVRKLRAPERDGRGHILVPVAACGARCFGRPRAVGSSAGAACQSPARRRRRTALVGAVAADMPPLLRAGGRAALCARVVESIRRVSRFVGRRRRASCRRVDDGMERPRAVTAVHRRRACVGRDVGGDTVSPSAKGLVRRPTDRAVLAALS